MSESERERRIREMIEHTGLTREEAAFAVDIDLDNVADDVINHTSFYGSEKDTKEFREKLKNLPGYQLICPPVNIFSPKEKIEAWLEELKKMVPSDEVDEATVEAQTWLDQKYEL